ncbi:thiolase family protein [Tissierella sp. MSJ-40]|uniref:Thiolase family protein n=1 Tax=Tissierella simiarum TaxID=2841534 RepID=A0ABS6E2H4_9FIRM|nr:thiolase family protein [Tissierella simiarum]MBU5436464.1 thiolase family protein [Tissierella simiarum]
MKNAVIVSAVRTPVGKCRGVLSSVEPYKMGAEVVKEAVKRVGISVDSIDEVIFGNLMGHDVNNMARMVALEAGIPIEKPALTVDRQCGTSLNAIALGAMMIQLGEAKVILAGGVESDSRRPYVMLKPEVGYSTTPPKFSEELRLSPEHIGNPNMGITAENLAQMYDITREELDMFSINSHKKASEAASEGRFVEQILPLEVDLGKGKKIIVSEDESIRKNANLGSMAKLKPVFKKDGVVTAGNSSPMSDGAGAVVIMEEEMAKSLGLEILARYKAFTAVGCDPNIMGIGPVPATRKILEKTNLKLEDIDLIELNEAFAAQTLACVKELGIDEDKLNVNGGAIALGHPLAGTGAILVTKMVYEMKRRDAHLGLVTFCCGGGQGVAMLLERD